MAATTDLWQFRGNISLSPAFNVPAIIAWIPEVEPFTKKKVLSAPNAVAAFFCACLIIPQGLYKLSDSGSSVRSISIISFPKSAGNTLPPMCPGIWNGRNFDSVYFLSALKSGMSELVIINTPYCDLRPQDFEIQNWN